MVSGTQMAVLAGFLETHGLFACNTAFQHATRHKTTWQGQYRDATNGTIVPIYNTIDFVFCRLSHKSLLTDSRAYSGTLLDSDHRLLIAQLDLSRLYYVWSENARPPSAKHARYNTEQLASGPLSGGKTLAEMNNFKYYIGSNFFFRVLHTRCCHIRAHAFALCVTMVSYSGEQGSSSSRPHRRGGGILCGSPQSQLTDCVLSM